MGGDGRYWCLDCNLMPRYSYYDKECLGAISDALSAILSPIGVRDELAGIEDAVGIDGRPDRTQHGDAEVADLGGHHEAG